MHWQIFEEEDGTQVMEFDNEGIDYLLQGMEQLRDMKPVAELVTPTVVSENDMPTGMSETVLRKIRD